MFYFIKRSFNFIILLLLLGGFSLNSVMALTPPPPEDDKDILSAFRQYKNVNVDTILVPTVVEVPFGDKYLERADFAILDVDNDIFLPYYYKKKISSNKIYYTVSAQPSVSGAHKMYDENNNTYTEFNYQEIGQANVVNLIIRSAVVMTSSKLTVLLGQNVALPNSVEIKTINNGREKIVLAETKMYNQTINFPISISKEWRIKFSYGQPLRINELRLIQSDLKTTSNQAVRFLVQPDSDYKIYFDPDRYVTVKTSEAGNLRSDEDVLFLPTSYARANQDYKIADIDNDGHADISDNCISVYNPDQKDLNKNGRGDICDDFDKDGVVNDKDNCPNLPNRHQRDIDGDGLGDECDQEESRITEKYKWIPWAGIAFALVVIIVLFFITARSKPEDNPPPSQ